MAERDNERLFSQTVLHLILRVCHLSSCCSAPLLFYSADNLTGRKVPNALRFDLISLSARTRCRRLLLLIPARHSLTLF